MRPPRLHPTHPAAITRERAEELGQEWQRKMDLDAAVLEAAEEWERATTRRSAADLAYQAQPLVGYDKAVGDEEYEAADGLRKAAARLLAAVRARRDG
jgi:hypothetical protein